MASADLWVLTADSDTRRGRLGVGASWGTGGSVPMAQLCGLDPPEVTLSGQGN